MPSFSSTPFMTSLTFILIIVILNNTLFADAHPSGALSNILTKRTDPFFPDQPPSCPICAQNYPSINSCAQAAPVLANFSMIIFNPGAFIDVIKCACTDTFQSAFPQCADCFIQTNQSDVLNTPDLPGIVSGMRQICALESTLLGNVSETDGEVTPSAGVIAPTPTPSLSGAELQFGLTGVHVLFVLVVGLLSVFSIGVL
ncbi:unnamed protein product [Somion occarium]|uniref:Uncharacterized protein n=1 Tax=Somion occarium TaxID=3059160 RepID=A0ABP1CRG1_9APHY